MRLTKYMIDELTTRVSDLLKNHTINHELKQQLARTAHREMVKLQPKQTQYLIHLGQAPKVISELVPRYQAIRIRLNVYTHEVLKAFAAHNLPEITGFDHGHLFQRLESVDLPEGLVLVADNNFPEFNRDSLESVTSWHRVIAARAEMYMAEYRATKTCEALPQVLAELKTLDAAMDKLPLIRAAVPQSWLDDAENAKAPKPASGMLDAESAARLRKIILGDRA